MLKAYQTPELEEPEIHKLIPKSDRKLVRSQSKILPVIKGLHHR
jgi:hypothetical protein